LEGANGSYSRARAINNSGEVVGGAVTSSGSFHAFSYTTAGGMINLGTLGGSNSYATAINNFGTVVGRSNTSSGSFHAFSYTSSGEIKDLGTTGGLNSIAYGINDSGTIVGYSDSHGAFVYSDGTMSILNTLTINLPGGWGLSDGYAINDAGDIVGDVFTGSSYEAYLLTPTPEPGSLAILAAGGIGLLLRCRQKEMSENRIPISPEIFFEYMLSG
jgi:probable HAF family extracellular repeat protein